MGWGHGDDALFRIQVGHLSLYTVLKNMDAVEAREVAKDVASALALTAESLELGYPKQAEVLQVADEARDLSDALDNLRLASECQAFWAAYVGYINWASNLEFRLGRYLKNHLGPQGAHIH